MDADSRKDHGGAGGPPAHAHAAAAGHKAGEVAAAAATPGSTAVSAPAADASVTFGLPFVLNYWKELDLETARAGMDEQGLKIAEHQETSTRNRRKLAESTRDFRKASVAEQPKLFVGLLKAYQEEVDNLTKRAKFAESAFLGLYQKLYEAPDPVPALASAAEAAAKASELLAENRKLSTELDEFRAESSHLKNQQATVRRLEERNRQLEQQMEEKVKEMVAMKQQVLAEESQRSLDVLKEREDALQEQLRAAKASLESMQRLHEMGQSQLFEVRAKSEEERAAKQYELNLLTDEIERAQSRLLTLEREKDTLKAKLTDANEVDIQGETLNGTSSADADGSNSGGAGGGGSSGWEAALRAKEAVVSELHAELHAVESRAADAREAHLAEVKRLHALIQSKDDTMAELLAELSVRPSAKQWEDLRKQVKILQAVGYNAVEVDDWEAPTNGSTGANGSGAGTSSREKSGGGDMGRLEALLLEKNRKMEHELTQAKVQLAERTKERNGLQEKADELEAQLMEHKSLVAKLEDDIVKGYNRGSGSSLDVSSATGRRGSGPADAAKVAAAAGGGTEASGDGRGSDSGANTGGGSEEENVVLAVVCGQRDRFRQRIVDLEEELTQCKDKCGRAAAEVERLKADNVKLYERIRYVQDYTSSSSSSSGTANRSARKSAQDPEAVDVELKYKKMYEDGLNPFAQFSTKEREQRVRDLGLRDRITLTGGKFLLSNKHARTFVFFYSIALHVLVFFAMYRLSTFSHYYKTAKYSTSNVVASAGAWSGAPSNHIVAAMVNDDDDRLPSL